MIKLLLLSLFLSIVSIGISQEADQIIGKYKLPNKLDIEIFKIDHQYFGKIIGLNGYNDGQIKDHKNPDKSQQNDLLMGKIILKGLHYNPEKKEWNEGQMYAPEKGMFFSLKVTKFEDNKITVVGSKYFFWHTLTWEKI